MPNSRLVYTAITRHHAQLSPRPDVPNTDFVCFSDEALDRDDWRIEPIEASGDLSPRMRAKFHKVFPPEGYEWTLWVDGSHVLDVNAPRIMDALISRSPSGLGLHRHPRFDCIYEEGKEVLTLAKVRGQPIEAQLQHYRNVGHPEHWGLWAGGSICRNDSEHVRTIARAWWAELLCWSFRDQTSLAFVLRQHETRPDEWPWRLYENPYFTAINHNWEL